MRRVERVSFLGMSDVSLRNITLSGIDVDPNWSPRHRGRPLESKRHTI